MKEKRSVSSVLAERIKERRAVTPAKIEVRHVKFTPEEMAIDAADVDASEPPLRRAYVRLDPDVRKAFPDEGSVNAALRKVIEIQKLKPAKRRKSA